MPSMKGIESKTNPREGIVTSSVTYPPMFEVEQRFSARVVKDPASSLEEGLRASGLLDKVRPGQKVAVGVGSRGIQELAILVRTLIGRLKERGARVIVIPAMGSHGGATSEGQARVLEKLGVKESTVGAPIVSNMEVVSLGSLDSGLEVVVARDALEVDYVVVVNRVKPHTAFRGEVESGLCKMLAVGLGRKEGASGIHRFGLAQSIVPAAKRILERVPVLLGVAIVEAPGGGIAKVEVVRPEEFVDKDRELLQEAWRLFPRIPTHQLDVLIVDRMGKDISGAGMDPNVIGMWRREGGERNPDYRVLVVLDLTDASYGNAVGIGMADLTTRRLMDKVDLKATYTNALTSGVLRSARLPIVLETDLEAVEAALAHVPDRKSVRMARILDTFHLGRLWVTEPVARELEGNPGISVKWTPLSLRFDPAGRLLPMD